MTLECVYVLNGGLNYVTEAYPSFQWTYARKETKLAKIDYTSLTEITLKRTETFQSIRRDSMEPAFFNTFRLVSTFHLVKRFPLL